MPTGAQSAASLTRASRASLSLWPHRGASCNTRRQARHWPTMRRKLSVPLILLLFFSLFALASRPKVEPARRPPKLHTSLAERARNSAPRNWPAIWWARARDVRAARPPRAAQISDTLAGGPKEAGAGGPKLEQISGTDNLSLTLGPKASQPSGSRRTCFWAAAARGEWAKLATWWPRLDSSQGDTFDPKPLGSSKAPLARSLARSLACPLQHLLLACARRRVGPTRLGRKLGPTRRNV